MDAELRPGPVAIIGPGRVGTVLAAALRSAGHDVVAVGGGREASRERFLARFPDATASAEPAGAARDAALVVLAVPDDVVEEVAGDLAVAEAVRDGQRVVHVAGSLGVAPL
ncbi:MAG: NAD(P)-binding domain-containing protein, partial [Nitriliruptorales bacterium]